MGNQELEVKMKNNNDTKVRPNNKEVIITVYVESDSLSHHPFKKINPKKISRKPPQTAITHIYDRRAHLLAYAQELRKNATSQHLQRPKNGSNSKPKHKKKSSTHNSTSLRRLGKLNSYATEITTYVLKCKIRKLTGVESLDQGALGLDIDLDDPPIGTITFKSPTGLCRTFPVPAFQD
ncbi:hypothetical protein ACLB2K_051089 [Fragaria x ananassa]